MSARDQKLLMLFVPVAIFAMYWLLLLNPALDKPGGPAEAARDGSGRAGRRPWPSPTR